MTLTDLTFSKQGEAYVSDPVQLQSTGVIPGMYIKVQSISQPTLTKILVSE